MDTTKRVVVLAFALAGVARAQVASPLVVSGTLTITSGGTNTGSLQYIGATVQAGSASQTIALAAGTNLVIRGTGSAGATCTSGADCWTTDFCEDNGSGGKVCCCHNPHSSVVNGATINSCYAWQYAANTLYGDGNSAGSTYQCGNCAACSGANGTCQAAAKSRSTARASSDCRLAVLGSDGTTCDAKEVCDGVSLTCPPDVNLAGGTVCRPAADKCDLASTCPGGSGPAAAVCAPNGFGKQACAQTTVNGGVCLGTIYCDGAHAACPSAAPPAPAGTLCRAARGACDVADVCDGVSTACPDRFIDSGTVCDPSGVACSGSSAACGASNVGYVNGICSQ